MHIKYLKVLTKRFIILIFINLLILNTVIADSDVTSTFDSPETYPMGVEYYENNLLVTSITTDIIFPPRALNSIIFPINL